MKYILYVLLMLILWIFGIALLGWAIDSIIKEYIDYAKK